MSAKMPDPLDVMVGAKIRIFRIHRRISQTELAEQIGVTFQQVQKYETGMNRVGASRLSRIATDAWRFDWRTVRVSRRQACRFDITLSVACRTGCIAPS